MKNWLRNYAMLHRNSSFIILNQKKSYGKENPSIYRHVDAYCLPRHSHHRFQPQACRPDLP